MYQNDLSNKNLVIGHSARKFLLHKLDGDDHPISTHGNQLQKWH